MKSLNEYIKSGKQIYEFVNKSNIKVSRINDDNSIVLPNFEVDYMSGSVKFLNSHREININPKHKFAIYIDRYYKNRYHIANISDMVGSLSIQPNSYEDFSEKDIIGTFETLYDAVLRMLELLGYNEEEITHIDTDAEEYRDDIKPLKNNKRMCDSDDFLLDVLSADYNFDADYLDQFNTFEKNEPISLECVKTIIDGLSSHYDIENEQELNKYFNL